VTQLQTWGQYGRAAGLCRETLTWLTPDSPEAAMTAGTLGILAQRRGDYDSAERAYRQVLEIFTRLGDQRNMSTGYHQLGMLAQVRGDYDAAEPLYRQALDISERLGDQAGIAAGYGQLGRLAQLRGDYDAAEPLYRQALDISERLGDQAGMARGYHQLGMLAQDRGDYDAAEPLYRQSLDISERIGDQAGAATSYAVLGGLSEAVGNLDQAVAYRVSAAAIRLSIGTVIAGDVRALTGLRRQLRRDRFWSAALASGLDEQSATSLMEMLDQMETEEEAAGN
jgi:tetratricopeptide (TPR) repeat protein